MRIYKNTKVFDFMNYKILKVEIFYLQLIFFYMIETIKLLTVNICSWISLLTYSCMNIIRMI